MGTVLQLYLVEISRRFSISLVKSISSSGILSDYNRFFAATQKGQFLVEYITTDNLNSYLFLFIYNR